MGVPLLVLSVENDGSPHFRLSVTGPTSGMFAAVSRISALKALHVLATGAGTRSKACSTGDAKPLIDAELTDRSWLTLPIRYTARLACVPGRGERGRLLAVGQIAMRKVEKGAPALLVRQFLIAV